MRNFSSNLLTYISLLATCYIHGQEVAYEIGAYEFRENKGQWPNGVHYCAEVDGGKIWLEKDRILYQFNEYHDDHGEEDGFHFHNTNVSYTLLTANFVGCNNDIITESRYKSKNYFNYFLGNDRSKWASDVHNYKEVTYKNLYDKIDLVFFEKDNDLKYEYRLAPGANPNNIRINYHGYKKMWLSKDGSLTIATETGQVKEKRPYAYQIKNGKIIEVPCRFKVLRNKEVIFELGKYDDRLPLVIDPVLIFATYNGAESDNFGMTATYAYDGKGYSGGIVFGNRYPTPATVWNSTSNFTSLEGAEGVTDVFISKYSEDGSQMLWTNFIGGGNDSVGTETVHSLICDRENNVYFFGLTSSYDFPIRGGFQTKHNGGRLLNKKGNGVVIPDSLGTDIYVAKFGSSGLDLMGSTFVGGSENDGVNNFLFSQYADEFRGEIMLDDNNNILICSTTLSPDFPTSSPFQPISGGGQDAVIFKLSNDFSSLIFSSFYGGGGNDAGFSVKIDSSQNIVFSGSTNSTNLPGTAAGYQPNYNGGKADGFVSKLNPNGTALLQSSYVGTNAADYAFFVEIDRWDNVYLVGQSLGNMPVINAAYSNPGSAQFIWKLNPALDAIEYSTVFGNGNGKVNISPSAFLVDVCGNVYVSGWGGGLGIDTLLYDMPLTNDAFQKVSVNGDFYMIVFKRDMNDILYASYLGGKLSNEHVDGGTSRFDKFGIIYQSVCGGCWGNSDFPTTPGAWSNNNLTFGGCNNLLFKFDFELLPDADFILSDIEGCAPFELRLDNESNDTVNSKWDFPPEAVVLSGGVNPKLRFDDPGTYEITISITDTICNLVDTAKKVITVYEALEVKNDTILCETANLDIWANSNGTATSFIWSDKADFSNVLSQDNLDSIINVSPTFNTTYYVKASNGWPLCDLIDSVKVIFVDGAMEIIPDTTICKGDQIELFATNIFPDLTTLTYSWKPVDSILSQTSGSAIVAPKSSMYFYVTATSDLGCTIIDSVWVNVAYIDTNSITISATPDLIPEKGKSLLSVLPTGYSYAWEPSNKVEEPNNRTTETKKLEESTEFTVTLSNEFCSAEKTVLVETYEYICGDVYIYVPNGFSPNGDNLNDILYVRGLNLEEIDFKIFDRWGELVFESTDQSQGWDGTFKGKALDPDVYKFHLRVICFDEQENLVKGNITLIR